MIKIGVFTCLMLCVILSHSVFAIPPPREIADNNLNESELIVIGYIVEVREQSDAENESNSTQTQGRFVLHVQHVVKGYDLVKQGNMLSVMYRPAPKNTGGLVASTPGHVPVKVASGDLVIAYLVSSEESEMYRPLLAGLSVVVLTHGSK